MKLFSEKEFNEAKHRELLLAKCDVCQNKYQKKKSVFVKARKSTTKNYCSVKCSGVDSHTGHYFNCMQCTKSIYVSKAKIDKRIKAGYSPSNWFCNHSCSASYNNTHKTKGWNRSKLEIFLEESIKAEYPDVVLLPNDKTAINFELDLFFPEYKFAIEINGITHYEPIYGDTKFERIQYNDNQKILLCAQFGIELCVIPNLYDRLSKKVKIEIWSKVKGILEKVLQRN